MTITVEVRLIASDEVVEEQGTNGPYFTYRVKVGYINIYQKTPLGLEASKAVYLAFLKYLEDNRYLKMTLRKKEERMTREFYVRFIDTYEDDRIKQQILFVET